MAICHWGNAIWTVTRKARLRASKGDCLWASLHSRLASGFSDCAKFKDRVRKSNSKNALLIICIHSCPLMAFETWTRAQNKDSEIVMKVSMAKMKFSCSFLRGRTLPGKVKLTRAEIAGANASQDFSRMMINPGVTNSTSQVSWNFQPVTASYIASLPHMAEVHNLPCTHQRLTVNIDERK